MTSLSTSLLLLLVLSLSLVFSFQIVDALKNAQSCIQPLSVIGGTPNYFPIRSETSSAGYTLTYAENYKTITNRVTGESFVLYYCDTSVPEVSSGSKLFSVPLSTVSTIDTTSVAFLEVLGFRNNIVGVSDPAFVTSACIIDRLSSGSVVSVAGDGSSLVGQAAFGNFQADPNISVSISTSPVFEPTLLKRAEWLKFYATFFNKEAIANKKYDAIEYNFGCLKSLAAQSSATAPVVAWVTYSNYGSPSWSYSNASYKRDLTESAGGQFYYPTAGSYSTAAAFLASATNIDVLIDESYFSVLGVTTDTVLSNYNVTSSDAGVYRWVNNIFREDGLVTPDYGLDWFNGAVVLADAVLSDMINVLQPGLPTAQYKRTWLRNASDVSSAPVVVSPFQCVRPYNTLVDPAPYCPNITSYPRPTTTGGSSTSSSSDSSSSSTTSTGSSSTSSSSTTGSSGSSSSTTGSSGSSTTGGSSARRLRLRHKF